jgi:hypothetical protein
MLGEVRKVLIIRYDMKKPLYVILMTLFLICSGCILKEKNENHNNHTIDSKYEYLGATSKFHLSLTNTTIDEILDIFNMNNISVIKYTTYYDIERIYHSPGMEIYDNKIISGSFHLNHSNNSYNIHLTIDCYTMNPVIYYSDENIESFKTMMEQFAIDKNISKEVSISIIEMLSENISVGYDNNMTHMIIQDNVGGDD